MSTVSSNADLKELTRSGKSRSGRTREFINRFFFVSCLLITSIAIITIING